MKTGSGKTTTWQWIVFIPLAALFVGAIVLFVVVSYLAPEMARGERMVRTEVLGRVEKLLPDGSLDQTNSHLLIQIEGQELRLRPLQPEWDRIRPGDTIEVSVGRSAADGSPVAYSYRKAESSSPPE
jgi:hypothetical protein